MVQEVEAQANVIRCLRRNLAGIISVWDILKKGDHIFCYGIPSLAHVNMREGQRVGYGFIAGNRLLLAHPNGSHAWLREP